MLSGILRAQNTSGTITGRVTDATGASISGARVSIMNVGSGDKRNLTTDSSGNYTAALLLPGSYTVTSEKEGFKTQVRTGITLQVDQTVRVDAALEIGSTNERIEVTANALTLDTDSAAIGTVVDQRQVSELPLNGRSFVNLLFLEPGAVQTGGEQSTFRYGTHSYRRTSANIPHPFRWP